MSKARGLADLGNAYSDGALSNRNLIINGAMQVAQRGASFAITATTTYTLDRWFCSAGSSGNVAVSQQSFTVGQTDVPNEPKNYVRLTCTNTPSDPVFGQKIEDVRNGAGQTVTLSFWAKADSAKTFTEGGYLQQIFGSGGSSDVNTSIGSWSVTTSWQRVTITKTLPSISGKTLGTGHHLIVRFDTNNSENVVLDITGVQLEVGDTATPFEHRSYGQELARCLRYYWRNGASVESKLYYRYGGHGESISSVQAQVNQFFPVPMRAHPTLTTSGVISWYSNGAIVNPSSGGFSVEGNSGGKYMITIVNNALTGLTTGRAGSFLSNNNTTSFMEFDAEL